MSSRRASGGPAGRTFLRVRRLPERGVYELATIHAILDAATHCHVAHVVDGRPVATPTLHWRVGDTVYWHGSVASRMLRTNAAGGDVCLTATLLDAWVLARSAFNHTANYRSVMCFGRPAVVRDAAAKARLLEALTERWFPGRWSQLRPVNRRELGATEILSLPLTRASAKVRDGGPDDPVRDRDWPVWAGVVPLPQRAGRAQPAADLAGRPTPPTVAPPGRAPRRRGRAT